MAVLVLLLTLSPARLRHREHSSGRGDRRTSASNAAWSPSLRKQSSSCASVRLPPTGSSAARRTWEGTPRSRSGTLLTPSLVGANSLHLY